MLIAFGIKIRYKHLPKYHRLFGVNTFKFQTTIMVALISFAVFAIIVGQLCITSVFTSIHVCINPCFNIEKSESDFDKCFKEVRILL